MKKLDFVNFYNKSTSYSIVKPILNESVKNSFRY